jgi:hypothetical protein
MNISWIGSPNYTAGRSGKIEFIVCHWMAGTLASADSVFQNTTRQTSAHYGVGQGGNVHQYVKESDTAWHSRQVNPVSIGIEHEGGPTIPITDSVYDTSAELIASIWKRIGKTVPLVKHNSFVATQCPGTLDLDRLYRLALNKYGGEEMTYDDWIMYNWFRLLEEDFASLSEFEKAIQENAQWHYNSKHTLRDVLDDEAKKPNFAKNIARDERARRIALEEQLGSVNTQLQQAINDKKVTLTQLQQLQAQTQTGTISQGTVDTINETNGIVKKIWDAITKLWKV